MSEAPKKEAKGSFTDLKSFVSPYGVNKYSIYTRKDSGEKSLVFSSITTRGTNTSFIPLNELSEVADLIK